MLLIQKDIYNLKIRANRMIPVVLDFEKYKTVKNFDQRRPDLYSDLVNS